MWTGVCAQLGTSIEEYQSPMERLRQEKGFQQLTAYEQAWICFRIFHKWTCQKTKTLYELIAFDEDLFADSTVPRENTGKRLIANKDIQVFTKAMSNQPAIRSAMLMMVDNVPDVETENDVVERILHRYCPDMNYMCEFPTAHSSQSSIPVATKQRRSAYETMANKWWANYFCN